MISWTPTTHPYVFNHTKNQNDHISHSLVKLFQIPPWYLEHCN